MNSTDTATPSLTAAALVTVLIAFAILPRLPMTLPMSPSPTFTARVVSLSLV